MSGTKPGLSLPPACSRAAAGRTPTGPRTPRWRATGARNAAAAVAAAAAGLTLAACTPGTTPGAQDSGGLSFPPGTPARPVPALAPYVVDGHGRNGDQYSVMCIPKREYDAEDENPEHEIEVPVTRTLFETTGFGAPCPLPPGWQTRPANRL